MERMTILDQDGTAYWVDARCAGGGYRMTNDKQDQARLDRLAAYEDTGLEPGEIQQLTEDIESRFLLWLEKHYGISGARFTELVQAERDGRLVALPTQLTFSGVGLAEATELVRAHKDGRCVVLPKVSEQDRRGMADFLHDCFAEWTHDPSVGLYGMTDGEAALASAIMAALTREEAEAALGGGRDGR